MNTPFKLCCCCYCWKWITVPIKWIESGHKEPVCGHFCNREIILQSATDVCTGYEKKV